MSKKFSIILIAAISFVVDILIGFGMFHFWFWILGTSIWSTIMVVITLFLVSKYAVGQITWAISKIKELETA